MLRPRKAFFLGSLIFFLSVGRLALADERSRAQKVDEIFSNWDRADSPGYAVAVFMDGKVVHNKGYGMANLDEQTPLGPESALCLLSLSKSFTSACVAIAMDQGHFSPDDDVRAYIPELHEFETPILIKHLLTCRSGLRDFYFCMPLLGRNVEDAFTSEDVLDVIVRQKTLMIRPGEKWSYSNTDYFLLAEVIHRTTGKTLREFAEEYIFGLLKMKHTLFQDTPLFPHRRRAVGYAHTQNKFTRHESRSDCWQGAGEVWTTTNDMLRWDECLRTKTGLPKGKFATGFLRDGSLLGNEQCLSAYPSQTYRGAKRIWYSGGGLGFVAHYVRFPDHDFSIVLLGNHDTDGSWPDSVESVKKLADLYLGDQLEPRPDELKRKHEWDKDVPAAPALAPDRLSELEKFVGSYRRWDNDFVELSLDRGQLQLAAITRHWQYGFRQPMQTIDGNRFRSARGYDEFEISFDSKSSGDSDEKIADSSRPTIRVQFEDGRDEVWTPAKLTSWSPQQLEALEGEYYCDELESVYRVTSANGQLFVQYNFGRKRLHSPTTPDTFVPAAEQFCIPVRFLRDESGVAIAFSIEFGRAGEVTFQKRK